MKRLVVIPTLAVIAVLVYIGLAHDIGVSSSHAESTCTALAGSGNVVRIAIVPAGFDNAKTGDVADFGRLANIIAQGFKDIEPYKSNLDKFTVYRADDYSGKDVNTESFDVWYNPILINAASVCNWNEIIVIARNSGWAGGNGAGYYSVVGSGTPPSCDQNTCSGTSCPFTPTCSWDYDIAYTALHESGHTISNLRHTCYPLSSQALQLAQIEKVSETYTEVLFGESEEEDPINCGVGFQGDPLLVCSEWDNPDYLNWVFPTDQHFGCYQGCDDHSNWYRPWYDLTNIMCRDDELENGFTPVDRKIIYDTMLCTNLNVSVSPDYNYGSVYASPSPNCLGGRLYKRNTVVTLQASPYLDYDFVGWEGDIITSTNPVTITMDTDKNVVADFQFKCYSLSTSVSPEGSGSVEVTPAPNCGGDKYYKYTKVIVEAIPSSDSYYFLGWSGDLTGNYNPDAVIIDGDKSVTANFELKCYSLLTGVDPVGSGSIEITPGPNCEDNKYVVNTEVSVKAIPGSNNFLFLKWGGDLTGIDNPATVTIDRDKNVTAYFKRLYFIFLPTISNDYNP